MNDLARTHQQDDQPAPGTPNPFARMVAAHSGANVGSVAIEQERAIAEAQGQLILAKRFPRSLAAANAEFMEACKSPEFAAQAFYTVPNRGTGPSIRFMEEAARCYGNFVYGHRELSRTAGKSEVEVYAWDMERNNRSTRQITVLHVRDTQYGPKALTDQNDIDGRVANVASKQMRGRIAALMPKAMVAAGIAACKATLTGNNSEPAAARIARLTDAFAKMSINTSQLTAYIGHALDNLTEDEIVDLQGVWSAIKEGAKASEYFSDTIKASGPPPLPNAVQKPAATAAQAAGPQETPAEPPAPPAASPTPAAPPPAASAPRKPVKVTSAPPPAPAAPPPPAQAPAAAAPPPAADGPPWDGDDDGDGNMF